MGYLSRLQGSITIEPPLPWSRVWDSEFLPGDRASLLVFRVVEQRIPTPDGEGLVGVRRAVAIEPTTDGPRKCYDLPAELQRIASTHPGHEFSGHLAGDVIYGRTNRGEVAHA